MSIVITHDLVKKTLNDNNDGFRFEKFAQIFFSAITQNQYKPVGGIHDGGADGISEDGLLLEEEVGINTSFVQISIDKQPKQKINRTINRLIEYGRDVKKLVYITSIVVNDIDKLEDEFFDKFKIRVIIRDANYIASNIRHSHQTEEAFKQNLLDTYDFLRNFGSTSISNYIKNEDANLAFLFSFIQGEFQNKTNRSTIINSITDSLILWALENTNPDENKFMTDSEILNKILETLPTTKTFIKNSLPPRIAHLSKVRTDFKRQTVQFHKQRKAYCLPLETRNKIIEQNIEDESLFVNVKNFFEDKIREFSDNIDNLDVELLVNITLNVLHLTFENKGLEFASFIKNPEIEFDTKAISYNIQKAIELVQKPISEDKKDSIIKLLNYIFYKNQNSCIDKYLYKLSETYMLLLSLKADSRIVDYFSRMSENFNLIVGSDLIVKALSENLLIQNKQYNINTLYILRDNKSKLICTEYIIDEIWNNLKTSDFEYKNYFASIDQYMTIEIARESSKILIRAFYYNKLEEKDTHFNKWHSFIEQFCDYDKLHYISGREQLKQYLINKFGLFIISEEEVNKVVNSEQVDDLKKVLIEHKKSEVLALHASTTVNYIYNIRIKNHESSNSNQFGYKTWWLTNERTTMKFTSELVRKNNGLYIIRPEFLLYYISLVPSQNDVTNTYKNVFPTSLGIKMSGRISDEEFHKVLERIKVASQVEPARLKIKIDEEINKLKGDFQRNYNNDDIE